MPTAAPKKPSDPTVPAATPVDWSGKSKEAMQKASEYRAAASKTETDYSAASGKLAQSIAALDEAIKTHEEALVKRRLASSLLMAADGRVRSLSILVDAADVDHQVELARERVKRAEAAGDPEVLQRTKTVLDTFIEKAAQRDQAAKDYRDADANLTKAEAQRDNAEKQAALAKKLMEAKAKLAAASSSVSAASGTQSQAQQEVDALSAQLTAVPKTDDGVKYA